MDLVESGIRHHFLPVPPSPCPPLTSFEKNLLPIFVADRFQAMLLKEGKIPLPLLICWLVYGGTTSTGHLSVLRGFLFQKIWGLLSMITLIEDVIKCGVWPGLAPGFMELRQGGSAWTGLYCSHSVCVAAQWPPRGILWSSSEKVTDWAGFKPVLLAQDDQKPFCRLKEVALWADRKLFFSPKRGYDLGRCGIFLRDLFLKRPVLENNMETYTTICEIDSQWEFALWGTQSGGSVTN